MPFQEIEAIEVAEAPAPHLTTIEVPEPIVLMVPHHQQEVAVPIEEVAQSTEVLQAIEHLAETQEAISLQEEQRQEVATIEDLPVALEAQEVIEVAVQAEVLEVAEAIGAQEAALEVLAATEVLAAPADRLDLQDHHLHLVEVVEDIKSFKIFIV
ncbi:hypothetical protein SAMN06265377_3681 [Flagellimonas pacifica]|uniref:Uncharacterized protein n=1 Tax=Flagellimonas pacifica TaxID=1247520 RepID=A0A285MXC5_9FLAO|nr:hypothetical protein SAMN06265377_3681 [Allomuricauda parva]